MDAQTAKPPLTQTRCFKDDTPEIASLGEILETREKARFFSEHVIHRALAALRRELGQPVETQAA